MQAVDKDWLKKKYIDEGLSPNEIASKYKRYSASTITRYLKSGGIEMRNASESLKRTWKHKKHPWIGKKHTQETKDKIRNALTGKTRTEQHGKNLSNALKGRASWNKGKHHSEETKKKMSEKRKEYFREHPDKIRAGEKNPMYGKRGEQSHWWGRKHTEETKKRIGKKSRGRVHSEETKKIMSKIHKGQVSYMKGRHHPEWVKKILSTKMKEKWKNPIYIKKYLVEVNRRPSRPERAFDDMTPNIVRYTGDRTWWRKLPNGKNSNPDFKVTGQNKVIFVHGDYWHRGEDPQILINLWKEMDFDCLVIWENEIYNQPERVMIKMENFLSGNGHADQLANQV